MAKVNIDKFIKDLDLEVLYRGKEDLLTIETSNLNRPGLQLTGYFDYFATDRIQVLGRQEIVYLGSAMNDVQRYMALDRLLAYEFPCIIISRGMEPPGDLIELAEKYGHPVFRSRQVTNKLMATVIAYLDVALAPRVTMHGVLVDVYGIGVLISGKSGIGKSETALELLRRGHRLVADDLVDIVRIGQNQLMGSSPANIRHFMEIRGIGIIDVRQMYGIGSVMNKKNIEMVAELEIWDEKKQYDRLGMDENLTEILGVPLPNLLVPVMPGRNMAIILEVAARNQRLKNIGYNSAVELHKRINEVSEWDGDA